MFIFCPFSVCYAPFFILGALFRQRVRLFPFLRKFFEPRTAFILSQVPPPSQIAVPPFSQSRSKSYREGTSPATKKNPSPFCPTHLFDSRRNPWCSFFTQRLSNVGKGPFLIEKMTPFYFSAVGRSLLFPPIPLRVFG